MEECDVCGGNHEGACPHVEEDQAAYYTRTGGCPRFFDSGSTAGELAQYVDRKDCSQRGSGSVSSVCFKRMGSDEHLEDGDVVMVLPDPAKEYERIKKREKENKEKKKENKKREKESESSSERGRPRGGVEGDAEFRDNYGVGQVKTDIANFIGAVCQGRDREFCMKVGATFALSPDDVDALLGAKGDEAKVGLFEEILERTKQSENMVTALHMFKLERKVDTSNELVASLENKVDMQTQRMSSLEQHVTSSTTQVMQKLDEALKK